MKDYWINGSGLILRGSAQARIPYHGEDVEEAQLRDNNGALQVGLRLNEDHFLNRQVVLTIQSPKPGVKPSEGLERQR